MCDKSQKIEKEQYWYDTLHPTYNEIRPTECNFIYPEVIMKSIESCKSEEHIAKLKAIHNDDYHKHLYRYECQVYKHKPCECILNDKVIYSFVTLGEAGRWVKENTKYKSKNPVSEIKAVCDGERPTAYGYKWRYKKGQETN